MSINEFVIKLLLSDSQKIELKEKRLQIEFEQILKKKRHSMRIPFSDGKFFDIDGVYNSQNDRARRAISRM